MLSLSEVQGQNFKIRFNTISAGFGILCHPQKNGHPHRIMAINCMTRTQQELWKIFAERDAGFMCPIFLHVFLSHMLVFPMGTRRYVMGRRLRYLQEVQNNISTKYAIHDLVTMSMVSKFKLYSIDHDTSEKCCIIQEMSIFELYSLKLPAWQTFMYVNKLNVSDEPY